MIAGLPTYRPGQVNPSKGICVYGKGGAGKTTLVGTMPGPGVVIDFPAQEGGTEVLADRADRISVWPVTDWDDLDKYYWALASGNHPFKWVGIDSITAAVRMARYKVTGEHPLKDKPGKISLEQRGFISDLVAEFVVKYRAIPKLFSVWIALEQRRDKLKDGSGGVWSPTVPPGALNALIPSMKIVGRMRIEYDMMGRSQRQLIIGPCPDMDTKARAIPTLPIPFGISDPNLETLLRYLAGQDVQLHTIGDSNSSILGTDADTLVLS